MQLKMSDKSLFAYLLRSPWWISLAVAAVPVLAARFLLPERYAVYALSCALPFVVTAAMSAWQRRDVPSEARVASTIAAVTAMPWRDFSALMEEALQRDGNVVTRTTGAADFILLKAGRTVLLSCKRWKAATHGLQALRELDAARREQDAREAIYVAAGALSDNALRFAAEHRITLMQGPELTRLLRLSKGVAKGG